MESIYAVAIPVIRLVAPGPDVETQTPILFPVREYPLAAWAKALLRSDEDVPDIRIIKLIVKRAYGGAGITEDKLRPLIFEAFHHSFCAAYHRFHFPSYSLKKITDLWYHH